METAEVYQERVERLQRDCVVAQLDPNAPGDLAKVLAQRSLAYSSAKQYASAVRTILRDAGLETVQFDAEWSALRAARKVASKPKKRSRKSVKVTAEIMDLLWAEAHRQASRKKLAVPSMMLFHGCLLFGLRPVEWGQARWDSKACDALVIHNAKTASRVMEYGPFAGRLWVRGNGIQRRLVLSPEARQGNARDLIEAIFANEREQPWQQHRQNYWRAFKAMVRELVKSGLLPRKYGKLTIYSARHQFAANAKQAVAVQGGALAALMGHASVRTAVQAYGRRYAGGSFPLVVKPDSASVEAVVTKVMREAPALPRPAAEPAPDEPLPGAGGAPPNPAP